MDDDITQISKISKTFTKKYRIKYKKKKRIDFQNKRQTIPTQCFFIFRAQVRKQKLCTGFFTGFWILGAKTLHLKKF